MAHVPSEEEVMGMKVAALKDALDAAGLPKSGLKAELQQRLLTHIQEQQGGGEQQEAPAPAPAPASVQEEEEEEAAAKPPTPPPSPPKAEKPLPTAPEPAAPAPAPAAPAPAPAQTPASPPKPKPQQQQQPAAAPAPGAPPKVDKAALEARLKQEKEQAAAAKHAAAPATPALPAPSPPTAAVAGSGAGATPLGKKGAGMEEAPPAAMPVSSTIRVDGFVRPFRQPQAEKLMEVKGGGALVANGFWMDMIKTHCYATFESEACAAQAREGLWGLQWPDERGGTLKAEFADVTAMEVAKQVAAERAARAAAKAANVPYVPPAARQQQQQQQQAQAQAQAQAQEAAARGARPVVNGVGGGGGGGSGGSLLARALSDVSRGGAGEDGRRKKRELGPSPDRSLDVSAASGGKRARAGAAEEEGRPPAAPGLDELFRATKTAKPKLYWLPLSEGAVADKRARRKALRREARERKGAGGGGGAEAGAGGRKRGRSYSRSRSRSRSRSPPRRR